MVGYGISKSGIIRFVLRLLRIHVPSGQVWTERSIALCLEQGLMLLHSLTTVYLSHYVPATAHAQLHMTISALDIMRTPVAYYVVLRLLYTLQFGRIWFSLLAISKMEFALRQCTNLDSMYMLSFTLLRSSIHCIRATRWSPTSLKHPCHLTTYYEAGIASL